MAPTDRGRGGLGAGAGKDGGGGPLLLCDGGGGGGCCCMGWPSRGRAFHAFFIVADRARS